MMFADNVILDLVLVNFSVSRMTLHSTTDIQLQLSEKSLPHDDGSTKYQPLGDDEDHTIQINRVEFDTVIMMSVYGMVVFGNILLLAVLESASVTSGLFIDQQKKNLYSIERDDANARLKRACSLRPFDVSCHQYCPRRWTNDWDNLIKYRNCTEIYKSSTFHCAKDKSGTFVEACAVPTDCYKGEEPILHFKKENKVIANVRCEQCSDDRFNPAEAMKSDEYSVCPYARRICGSHYGLVECDIVAGEKRTWTDSKCRCNITGNFLPQSEGPNNCTDDDDFRCYENRPCPDTPDGRKQEYLSSNYTCVPKCGEGYHPRTLDTDECIPIFKSNDTSENNTTTAVSITTSPQVSVENVTEKVHTPPDKTKTTTETPTKGQDKPVGLYVVIAVIVIIVVFIPVGMFCYFCIYKRARKKKKDSANTGESGESHPLMQLPVSNDISDGRIGLTREECKKVLAKCITKIKVEMKPTETTEEIIRLQLFREVDRTDLQHLALGVKGLPSEVNYRIWGLVQANMECYEQFKQCLKTTKQKYLLEFIQKTEDQVVSERREDIEVTNGNDDNLTENRERGDTICNDGLDDTSEGQSLRVDIPSSPPESGDNTDHNEPGATSQESQKQSTRVDVHFSPPLSENDTDLNEPGAKRGNSQGQSSHVDVPSSILESGGNTDHRETGATNQDSQTKLKWIEDLPVTIKERKLTDQDLTKIPEYIGVNWETVAYKMGQSRVNVQHITNDNNTQFNRIYASIHTWKTNNADSCTVERFLKILNDCSKTTIEWPKLKRFIENLSDDSSS